MLQGEHSAILSTFNKLSIVIKIFVLTVFERPFYTCFTVKLLYRDTNLDRLEFFFVFFYYENEYGIDTISLYLSILYFEGSQVKIS